MFGYSLPLTPFVEKLPSGALRLTATLGPAVRDLVTENLTVKVACRRAFRMRRLLSKPQFRKR